MMHSDLLLQVLRTPNRILDLDESEWDQLICQARRTNLLARLAVILAKRELLEAVPHAPQRHLTSARRMSERQDRAMRFEIDCIRMALAPVPRPVILLKGAAYLAAGLPNAEGRMFGDVDILVPLANIQETETELLVHGWKATVDSAYDQKYYRTWMHEIPPLEHAVRQTVIDVHHSILPHTARIRVDIAAFFTSAQALGSSGIHVLCPEDMILHSAAHLFHEGEFDNALRDLVDLHTLLTHFSPSPAFWDRLVMRAELTGLTRPLYYALRYSSKFLATDIPLQTVKAIEKYAPPGAQRQVMDICYVHALRPVESRHAWQSRLARFALFLRSHWIRMPMHLLIMHLSRKAFLRLKPAAREESEAQPT